MDIPADTSTLPFEEFSSWLKRHFNCIVRAGGPGFTFFDLPDLHWHLSEEGELLVVQLMRGKETISEMVVPIPEILYVQSSPDEDEMVVFDCIASTPEGPNSICYFLMAHPYEVEPESPPRWTH